MYKANFSVIFLCLALASAFPSSAQDISAKLREQWQTFQSDSSLRAATTAIYIEDLSTGQPVFASNENQGMAPASTQKLFTSIAALHYLGPHFRYNTQALLRTAGTRSQLVIRPSWDPSLGTERFTNGAHMQVINDIVQALVKLKIKTLDGITVESSAIDMMPGGWTWADIGQYYGAAAWPLNWHENQYDMVLNAPAGVGKPVVIAETQPALHHLPVENDLLTGPKGSGDQSYIYYQPGTEGVSIQGTIPESSKNYRVSGSIPNPHREFQETLKDALQKAGVKVLALDAPARPGTDREIAGWRSNELSELNQPFLKRSINLYGEALLRTIGAASGNTTRQSAIDQLKRFYDSIGIDPVYLGIRDGSGLSPENRVTAKAEVQALKYARTQSWYNDFYISLPEYNGMHMKSGTISQAKGFAGYHRAANGKEYVFSILVNNYQGAMTPMVQKMYKVLDLLK